MKIAEEEIKRTSEEAVKEALIEADGELAYEMEKSHQLEIRNNELEISKQELRNEVTRLKKIMACSAGGIVVTTILFSLCYSFIK